MLPLLVFLGCSGGFQKYGYDSVGFDLDSGETGGGGTSDDSGGPTPGGENQAPVADAGDDLGVNIYEVVELDGGGSYDPDGDPIDYLWVITDAPDGSVATLINDRFVDAQFIPDVPGVYAIELTVTDPDDVSDTDTIEVTAADTNSGPTANAGPDQTVTPGATVYLDGSGSTDPDGDPLVYLWTITTKPGGSGATLSDSGSSHPTFVADLSGIYVVSLTVTDGETYSSADLVTITAESGGGDTGSSCGCRSGAAAGGSAPLLALAALLFRRRSAQDRV